MTDPIRESVAKRLYPEAWYFAGSDEDKCAALAKADYAIRAVTGALEAQGYVVVPREPFSGLEYTCRHAGGCRHPEKCRPEGCAGRPSGLTLADVLRAASNKETGR